LLAAARKTDIFSHVEVVDGRIWLRPEGTKYFCGDLSEQEQKLVWATQGAPKPDLFEAKVGGTAWKSKPRANAFPARLRARRDPQGR